MRYRSDIQIHLYRNMSRNLVKIVSQSPNYLNFLQETIELSQTCLCSVSLSQSKVEKHKYVSNQGTDFCFYFVRFKKIQQKFKMKTKMLIMQYKKTTKKKILAHKIHHTLPFLSAFSFKFLSNINSISKS